MAKKQTRGSISVNRDVFDRFKRFCDRNEIPMSAFLEFALEGDMAQPLDRDAYERWRTKQLRRVAVAQIAAAKRAKHAARAARFRAASAKTSNGNGSDA